MIVRNDVTQVRSAMNNPIPLEYVTSFADANQAMMQQLTSALLTSGDSGVEFSRFAEVASVQQNYLAEMSALWVNTLMRPATTSQKADKSDRRFARDQWNQSPYHNFLKDMYLVNTRFVNNLIERAIVDEKTRGRLRFFARQILDAMSPANYLATNPQALQRALETGGDSVALGIRNLLQDISKGRITMSDEQAFEVGRNLAVTPGAVVFENELIQLIQYRPLTDQVGTRPLLIVPPAINKFYVLDLEPANSFVRYAVEQGNTIFMVSWRNVTAEQGHLTWGDYLELGIAQAIDSTLAVTGADQLNALGFCVGGTLLGCATAVLAVRGEKKIASLTFMTTMLDFSDPGEIGLLIDEAGVAARERMIGKGGIMPGEELAFVFSTLRGNDLIWPYVSGNYLEGRQPDAFDLLFWNADSTNLPGPMYCWYVRNTYLENNLCVPGKTIQCGVPLHLGQINVPTYVLASREDHIVPWRTAYRTTKLVSGSVRFVLAASGHIAGAINPASRNKRSFWIDGKLDGEAEQWLQFAQEVPGSWWNDWSAWLQKQAGPLVPARSQLGGSGFSEIEVAPGKYVKERSR
jgi:polyhydroxyalkanoate synthase subunit PhaC